MKTLMHRPAFRLGRIVALLVFLLVMMTATHPANVPALMLVVPFMLLFAAAYYVILELVLLMRPDAAESINGAVRRPRLLAAIGAGFPVLLLVLQSIMELNTWDVVLASAILITAYVFVARGSVSLRRQ